MPGGDRTGPFGMGSRTGRAAGYCAGYGAPGYMNWGQGSGYSFGFGRRAGFGPYGGRRALRGRGYGRSFSGGYQYIAPAYVPVTDYYNEPNPEEEKAYLTNEAKILKEKLSLMEKRLAELEAAKKNEA